MIPISDADHQTRRFPFINILLILANIFFFLIEITSPNPDAFINTYALVPTHVNFSNWATLTPFITSMFLHGGFLHIAGNMIFLWVFGDNVEDVFGHFQYLIIYLLSGIVGALAQYLLSPGSDVPMLGASGAIAGSLGAYFVLFPSNRIKSFIFIPPFITFTTVSAGFMLGYWIVIQLISGFGLFSVGGAEQGGIAYLAHIAGFAVGYLFAKTVPKQALIESI